MFTGLIETVGELTAIRHEGNAATLLVSADFPDAEPLQLGESIAVNGVCLTVEQFSGNSIQFHALSETLRRTNLGSQPHGAAVNLERALKLGARLGGHVVTGHVDATAKILSIGKDRDDIALKIELPRDIATGVVMKGSIAVNGISLTIAKLAIDNFEVRVIPHTWSHTNLASLNQGAFVNIETDILGKYALRQLEVSSHSNITMDTLANAGFF